MLQYSPPEAATVESDLQALNALLSGDDALSGGVTPQAPPSRPSLSGGRQSLGDRPPPPRASRNSGGFENRDSMSGEYARSSPWQRTSGMEKPM